MKRLIQIIMLMLSVPDGALAFTLTSIGWAQGSQNLGGIVGNIFYAPVEDIETFPDLEDDGGMITAEGSDFVMKDGKYFISIYHTAETGMGDDNSVGERDGKGIENMLEFFHPGNKIELEQFKRFALNTPAVVIYKDTHGQYRIIGVVNLDEENALLTGDIPAYMESVKSTTGKARADRKGSTFQFKQPGSPHSPIFYVGDIPLA